jgi:sodium-dependent dicarboxylate transporter 2/3/5
MHGIQAQLTEAEERFERYRQAIGYWLGPAAFALVLLVPLPSLSPEAHRLAAVMSWVLIYWVCEPVPMAVTALFGPALCVVLGVADAKTLLASFSDPVVFVFIGSFILAEAVQVHGLDRRMALALLSIRWVGNSTRRVMFVFGALAAFVSLWLSNTATTAMLLPIALGILAEIGVLLERRGVRSAAVSSLRISRGLLLLTAYSASVGGIGTPIGTPPNLIGIGMIHKLLGVQITFFGWMQMAMPILVVMYLALFGLILVLHPPEVQRLEGMADYFQERRRALGAWTQGQINALIAFLVAVTLWVVPGVIGLAAGGDSTLLATYQKNMPEGIVAILAACLLFVLPVDWKNRQFTLTWREAARIDWGTIFLFGGGIALGSLAFSTGLASVLGQAILQSTGITSPAGITFMAILLGILISEATSNTASANMVVPVAVAVAQAAGIDPLPPALGACLGASYGFMLPVSTLPNAMVYGTGMVPITSMIKTGVVFDLVGLVLIWLGLVFLGTPVG